MTYQKPLEDKGVSLLQKRKLRHRAAKHRSYLPRVRWSISKYPSPQIPVQRALGSSLVQCTNYWWLPTFQASDRVALMALLFGRDHRSSISQSVVSTVTCALSWIMHIRAHVRAIVPSAHAAGKVPSGGFTLNQSPQNRMKQSRVPSPPAV